MPFADGEFDALVCLSVLEHIVDLEEALASSAVSFGRGIAVLGFPVVNRGDRHVLPHRRLQPA